MSCGSPPDLPLLVPLQQQLGVGALGVRTPAPELRIGICTAPGPAGERLDRAAQRRDAVAAELDRLGRVDAGAASQAAMAAAGRGAGSCRAR
jgi:hypothetical protein